MSHVTISSSVKTSGEWSRLSEDPTRERTRLANRIREQLWLPVRLVRRQELPAVAGPDFAAQEPEIALRSRCSRHRDLRSERIIVFRATGADCDGARAFGAHAR